MKIKIASKGCLEIERAGKWKRQTCPHTHYTVEGLGAAACCGDWCPLFGEPIPEDATTYTAATLELCRGIWHGEFIDERPRHETETKAEKR